MGPVSPVGDREPVEPIGEATSEAVERRTAALAQAAIVAGFVAFLTLVVGLAVAVVGSCPWAAVCGPVVAEDIIQARLDVALPAPRSDVAVEQTFVPTVNGLSEIELILVRYGGEEAEALPASGASLSLRLLGPEGAVVASDTISAASASHNQTYVFRFAPQPDSAGKRYRLELSGTEDNHLSVWGYSLDVYDAGDLRVVPLAEAPDLPATDARELRFTTRATLSPRDGLAVAARMLVADGALILLALLFIPLPGCLTLLAGRGWRWDAAAWWATAFALGMVLWPIVWYWVSLAGGHFSRAALWAITFLGWAMAVFLNLRRARSHERRMRRPGREAVFHALLLLVLVAGLGVRLLAVRDLSFPPWVDSSRHGLITAVIAAQGRTPENYAPYLPVERFPYHFGFHTVAASLLLMGGGELPDVLLVLGQLLNALLPLTVYAAGWMVTRRRGVGLLAAFLVALPFFFPAYYATWGRMTQLAAMLVLPILVALTWRIGRGWSRAWPLVGLLAAGVFLLHFRVFVFYVPYAVLVFALHALAYRRPWPLVKAGALALALVAPRLRELISVTDPLQAVQSAIPGYNDFPSGYYTAGWERYFIWAAGAGLVVVVAGALLRRRWATYPLLLAAWVGSLFLLLSGERLGLPETWLINLNSMYISLFLPLSLFLAIVVGQVWHDLARLDARLPQRFEGVAATAGGAGAGLLIALLALFGARQQADILNPQTILAAAADRAALAWVNENLPDDALVGVNSWLWLGNTWAAADGGAWLVPLTGRMATTPPIDHIYDAALFGRVAAFNEAATAAKDWSTPEATAWLREQGVTHVMVGQRGGFFDPATLVRNAGLELLYQQDGVFVFAVRS